MSTSTASARTPTGNHGLSPGTVVGGRFEVERAVGDDALGTILAARDQKTQRPIALRVLGPGLVATPEAVEVLRAEIKTAAALTHRNVVATYGMGAEKTGARFVACEWLQGQPLTVVVARKKAEGQSLSLRGAYNVIANVAKALTAAHEKGASHGALRPAVVWISKNGRVKVSELGIARAILRTAGPAALGATEQPFLAPEIRAGGAPDARTDVFGLGGLLYTMLTGRTAGDDFVPPSQAHPEGSADIDAILLRCLASDPAARFATPEDVRAALAPHVGGAEAAEGDAGGLGMDIDVDVDSAMSEAPPPGSGAKVVTPPAGALKAPAPPKPVAPPKPAVPASAASSGSAPRPIPALAPAAAPKVGQRVSIHEEFRPSFVDGIPGAAPAPAAAPVRSSEVDLGSVLNKITENDAARWMVQKDKLDHGPFSGRELVQLIAKGEVLGDHGLLNMDTGERRKVADHPDFVEFVEQYRLKKAAADEKQAIVTAAKVEKTSNAVKFMIAGGVLVLIMAGVGIFFLTRQAEQDTQIADADLADLYERGQVEIEGTAGILPDPPRGSGRRGGHRGGRAGAPGTSYEDAMSQVVDIGDATGSGGEGRLSPSQVAGVMNGRINSFFPCVGEELRGGRSLGRVRIDMAIAGSGAVLGSSVRAGSPEFQRCVQGRVAAIRFPSFGAPRMGASYSFDASQ
ncbi:protein kinase domain-containing protein [Sandaracinus amylolyticus]|uniref:protein kinase domain-containing protein n=1 Tax=Sandaracinus amylolyticus TaxID=927083 RepID=UPI001F015277|nr:protein kinase [Sandaracinus amylolyticus]UJR79803.1 Serine/threonine-protein kinase PknB [Sandaracinus amylolyticus]